MNRLARIAESYAEADLNVKRESRTPSPETIRDIPANPPAREEHFEMMVPIHIDEDELLNWASDEEEILIPPPEGFGESDKEL